VSCERRPAHFRRGIEEQRHQCRKQGPIDAIRDLGKRIAKRWSKELHGIVCGEKAQDTKERRELLSALLSGVFARRLKPDCKVSRPL
jgi:hypothetical protein